jgi:sugar lactone lactonase YvrE
MDARVLFRPDSAEQRFLPEGPIASEDEHFSWVGIQHGVDARTGSLNIFDLRTTTNRRFDLPGRVGFAFPYGSRGSFLVGVERSVQLFDTRTGTLEHVCGPVDANVQNTIINDATLCDEGLIFGCKDVGFAEAKAGLYFWRGRDRRLFQLRWDQICSNGKKVVKGNDGLTLLDIDSPRKTVMAYPFDPENGRLGEGRVVIDLRGGDAFPDGMILAPDGQSVIISFYDPRDVPWGETRQYRLADGAVETIWRTPQSPRATCPLLMRHGGAMKLIITTAVEHMPAEQLLRHPNAGCLFEAETGF